MAPNDHPLHVIFFPVMFPGHFFPMLDLAKLFAARGVAATVVTTPANAAVVRASLAACQHPVEALYIQFPAHAGPDISVEGLGDPASVYEKHVALHAALPELREPFRRVLAARRPDAAVTDSFFPWTADDAAELGVPRLVFNGTGFFSLCGFSSLTSRESQSETPTGAEGGRVVMRSFPHRVEMLRSQLPDVSRGSPMLAQFLEEILKSDERSYGVVVNSFYGLEAEYVEYFTKVARRRAWHVGPLSLCSDAAQTAQATIGPKDCLRWLDTQRHGTVVYLSFGSLGRLGAAQLSELAAGLEQCGLPFLWVVKEEWEPGEAFLERTRGRGVVVCGWAPQRQILRHPALGAFVTHCGWNSCLEGASAGVPMVTWPLFAEQFFNEKLVVEVLKIGVAVGATTNTVFPERRPLVAAAAVARALELLMDDRSEQAESVRERAAKIRKAASAAVEAGGSSHADLGKLIEELTARRAASRIQGA